MRIVITSGMFLQATGREAIRRMVVGIGHCQPDLLVVGGDIGGPLRVYEEGLSQLLLVDCPVAVVAGRQDLAPLEGETCQSLYNQTLPDLVEDFGYVWLDGRLPLVIGSIGVTGSLAWCASMANSGGRDPMDEVLALELAPDECEGRLEHQLALLEADDEVQAVLAVTSLPLFDNQRDPNRGPVCVNTRAGAMVEKCAKVRWVVSGAGDSEIHGETEREEMPSIATAVVGSRPFRPRYLILDTE